MLLRKIGCSRKANGCTTWSEYTIRAGSKPLWEVRSPQELSAKQLEQAEAAAGTDTTDSGDWYRWIGLRKVEPPLEPMEFRTTTVRYLVLGIFSRDRGMRSATLEFYLGGGAVTQRQPLKGAPSIFHAIRSSVTPASA